MARSGAAANDTPRPATLLQVEAVAGDLSLFNSFGRIGGNLTPAEIRCILGEADMGRPARMVDLVHESRQKDSHLQATLGVRELAMQALGWDCIAPEGARKRDQKVAEACRDALRAVDAFPTLVTHLTGESVCFGHATAETMWEKQGPYIVPADFRPVSARRFAFRQSDGALIFLQTPNDYVGVELQLAYPGKFVQVRRRINGDVLPREGLARGLLWAALFRNWGTADWLKLAEMAWKPWRVGRFTKENPSTSDVNGLKTILNGMAASGIAIVPMQAEVEVKWPQFPSVTGSAHKELIEYMAREISKAVLGGSDTIEPGPNGARASTEVRNEVRKDIRNADALAIAQEIKRQVVEPFVRMNFGEKAVVPEFFFLTEDPEDLEKFSRSIVNLRKAGLKIPAGYVYDKTGIPEPDEDDVLLGDGEALPDGDKQDPDEAEADDGKASKA